MLITSVFVFILGWLIHFGIWRVWLPRTQLKALLLIFMSVWPVGIIFLAIRGSQDGVLLHILYFSALYWSAALSYVITYSAMEGDSPTLSLTRHLYRRGESGLSHEEIEEFFRQRPFLGARVKALITDNIFIEEQGGFRLSPGRYLFFHTILLYRRIVFGPVNLGG